MKAVVKRISIAKNRRIVVISDIHGSLQLFLRLLEKVQYSEQDLLILAGDLVEKGTGSLETLQYVMELSKKNEVYAVSGNCDAIWEDIENEAMKEELLEYMLFRKNSILNEMCQELAIEVNAQSDITYIKQQIAQNFSSELKWLEQLPHIIESEDFIFAHAGVDSENLEEQEADEVMRRDAFIEEGKTFSKYVIVGHWPTVNYSRQIGCCNPVINKEQKIISIDGGNVIKSDGQLNALLLQNGNITFEAEDSLPKGEILEDQQPSSHSIYIVWGDNEVEVLEQGEEFSLCRHKSTGHELWIQNNKLFNRKERTHCHDCTDYFLEVKKGDKVSIVEETSRQALAKKDGVIGWVWREKVGREE